MMDDFGVRVKVYTDGCVAVLLLKEVDGKVQKFYLDYLGNWQPVLEGEPYPKIPYDERLVRFR
jgi:hypothetical protein